MPEKIINRDLGPDDKIVIPPELTKKILPIATRIYLRIKKEGLPLEIADDLKKAK